MSNDSDDLIPKTHYRTIFLSDIHLGTKGCQADRLVDFLKRHTCDELYLVGDIIDGWQLKSNFYWPQKHSDVVRRVLTMAKRGTKVTYVAGNHDEMLRRFIDLQFGNIAIVGQAEYVAEDGTRFLVIHGDQFDFVTSNYKWLAFVGDIGYQVLIKLNRFVNFGRKLLGYEYWSLSAWIKSRVKQAVNFIGQYEKIVADFCRREGYEGIVCGHIHHADISRLSGVKYMNCGDWVESCTAIVEDDDGSYRILDWSRPTLVAAQPLAQSKAVS